MRQAILSIILIFSPILVETCFAQEARASELQFSIKDAFFVAEEAGSPVVSFGIIYQVKNISETKKIDLQGDFSSSLSDEFGNQYRSKSSAADNLQTLNIRPKNFPSFYPGDIFEEVLFFEAPVAKASDLTLQISASSGEEPLTVELHQPLGQLVRTEDASFETFQVPSAQEPLGIAITEMGEGQIVEQGQVLHAVVELKGWSLPSRITISAVDHVLEDNAPESRNVYDLNIPLDLAPGAYIFNVIAQWPQGNDFLVLSDQLHFYVKDAIPLDLL